MPRARAPCRSSNRWPPKPRTTPRRKPARAPTSPPPAKRNCARRSPRREAAEFASAAESLRQAMQSMPELAELSKQLIIDQTPEGPAHPAGRSGRSLDVRPELGPAQCPRPGAAARHVDGHQPVAQPHLDHRPHQSAVAGSGRASAPSDWPLSSAARRCLAPDPAARRRRSRSGLLRSRARPDPIRCIPTIRRWPATAASPSSCCARLRCCPRTPACDGTSARIIEPCSCGRGSEWRQIAT